MIATRRCATQCAALLILATLPCAIAHGDEDAPMKMDMAHHGSATPMKMSDMEGVRPVPSYFSHPEHTALLYAHIALMTFAWVVLGPVAVMLSIARSRLTFLSQVAFNATNAAGTLISIIYNHKTPDLYEGNAHHKIGWALTWIAATWMLMGLLNIYTNRATHTYSALSAQPASQAAMAEHARIHDLRKFGGFRWSRDSGLASETDGTSLASSSRSSSVHSGSQRHHSLGEDSEQHFGVDEQTSFLQDTSIDKVLSSKVPGLIVGKIATAFNVIYVVLERFMIMLGFVAMATGAVDLSGIGRGQAVFNILAHFIKGSIFFLYGLITFGRYMGSFADQGWAWNAKPTADIVGWRSKVPSAEFVESAVIACYGYSNVWLEHLAASDGPWTAMDIEHVAISILFAAGGTLGMLIESARIRRFLNNAISDEHEDEKPAPEQWRTPKSYSHSLNPIPSLVVLLLGSSMASHTQHSALSSAMHRSWGILFAGFAVARMITYLGLWIAPVTSYLPSRPMSEIVASWCLVAGGLLFMASNKDTVAAMESFEIDAMAVFMVLSSVALLVLALEMVIVSVKGWATARQRKIASQSAA